MALTGWVRPRHAPGATAAWLMAPSVSGSQVEAHGFGMVCCMGRTCRAPGAPSHTEVWHGKEARRFLRRTRDCHRRICTPLSTDCNATGSLHEVLYHAEPTGPLLQRMSQKFYEMEEYLGTQRPCYICQQSAIGCPQS
ncbi:uncharacterized protein LY89DRAFT_713548 [Mollisia scopiformis]|uniref:Uncharacterized protein n=1 Tax=Mollisia scopiformis TaxID=149040 RepID=A0A194XSI3_MOLSC|nr:uncharacterized protein LY89DRAFT_713548 [Mollisia scopiformis]KUJ22999.1 hypothetical protein LY89DRAFT_713548 [Mollisia scopiformis]